MIKIFALQLKKGIVDLRKRHSPSHHTGPSVPLVRAPSTSHATPPAAHARRLTPPPEGVELDLRVKVGASSRSQGTSPSSYGQR